MTRIRNLAVRAYWTTVIWSAIPPCSWRTYATTEDSSMSLPSILFREWPIFIDWINHDMKFISVPKLPLTRTSNKSIPWPEVLFSQLQPMLQSWLAWTIKDDIFFRRKLMCNWKEKLSCNSELVWVTDTIQWLNYANSLRVSKTVLLKSFSMALFNYGSTGCFFLELNFF
jgi:hypothetical protein